MGLLRQERSPCETPDAVLVVPPPSPSDTNPPLGPAILARSALRAGFRVRIIDLNAIHIGHFRDAAPRRDTAAVGDHGKDRPLVAHAAEWLYGATGLYEFTPEFLPDGANPVAGMHYPWEAVSRAVAAQVVDGSWWEDWLDRDLFSRFSRPPVVLGVSVMGASQVFPALVIFRLAKRRWPSTVTAAGGSHMTLLAGLIAADDRYRDCIDIVLPGHSEDDFVDLLRHSARVSPEVSQTPPPDGSFEYEPLFDPEQLLLYGRDDITIPVQFTRGCAYARCSFCTYPAVEPMATPFDPDRALAAVRTLASEYGVWRFSVKDSLFTVPMMESFALALSGSGTRVLWSATTKANRRIVRAAPLLAESGLATLELGVESVHPRTQRQFDKRASISMIEDVILALVAQGVLVVINLIFGAPGDTLDEAEQQLAWYTKMRQLAPGYVDGSLNMLEIVRGSPMEGAPPSGVTLMGVAPWAYCYQWNAPRWRTDFTGRLRTAELEAVIQARAPGGDLVSGDQTRNP